MATRNIGLANIKIGDIAADGSMGTDLVAIGNTAKDSASLTQTDPTITDFYIEEIDDPVESFASAKGTTTLKWDCIDLSATNLKKVLGGTVTAAAGGNPEKWEPPASIPIIEQSIEVDIPNTAKIQIPRARITANLTWNLKKTEVAKVSITATALVPTKDGIAMIAILGPTPA